MVKSSKDRMRNNVSEPLDWTCAGRILLERNVSSCFIIISEVFCKNSPKVLFAENDQMISALAPDRPNQAFNIAILPRCTERGRPVSDAHRPHPCLEDSGKCSVIVANEIFRRAIPGKRLGDLPREPTRLSGFG
jgi:hypothetical protein